MDKLFNYFREAYIEMKKVTWPTKKETYRYTMLVIGVSLVMAAFLGGLDYLFSFSIEKVLTR